MRGPRGGGQQSSGGGRHQGGSSTPGESGDRTRMSDRILEELGHWSNEQYGGRWTSFAPIVLLDRRLYSRNRKGIERLSEWQQSIGRFEEEEDFERALHALTAVLGLIDAYLSIRGSDTSLLRRISGQRQEINNAIEALKRGYAPGTGRAAFRWQRTSLEDRRPLTDLSEEGLVAYAREHLDWRQFESICGALGDQTANKLKYLDNERWLRSMWKHAVQLDLHELLPQRVLDLGTGPGHFPYVCKVLGHEAWSINRPGELAYQALTNWMGLDVVQHKIRAHVPLPTFPARFDLVTAFRVGFNSKGREGKNVLFDIDDWAFFLDDIKSGVLKPGGRLILKMINQDGYGYEGLKFGDPQLMEYFESRGAAITRKGRIVWFDELK